MVVLEIAIGILVIGAAALLLIGLIYGLYLLVATLASTGVGSVIVVFVVVAAFIVGLIALTQHNESEASAESEANHPGISR